MENFQAQAMARKWLNLSLPSRDVFSPECPNTLLILRIVYARAVGGPCLRPSLAYVEERCPSTMSYLIAENSQPTSPQLPIA